MADGTKIEWTDATWNVITGCSVASPGCAGCYAMKLAGTRLKHTPSRQGLTTDSKAGPVWNGQVRFNEQWLTQPIKWKAPRRIFVCAHGDLFHENVPDEWIDHVFAVMACSPRHTFQVLTKRAGRMLSYLSDGNTWNRIEDISEDRTDFNCDNAFYNRGLPLPNVWLGVSAEDQTRADERIPDLLATPAAKRFVSIEPMIMPVDLTRIRAPEDNDDGSWKFNALQTGDYYSQVDDSFVHSGDGPYRGHRIDWVIAGGESGPNARPMHPDWPRTLRDQCQEAGVPFFFKQWGEFSYEFDQDRDDPDGGVSDRWTRKPGRWINLAGGHGFHGNRVHYAHRVGKKRAGAMLDGREWREMPA